MQFRFNGHYLRIPCHQSRVTPLRFTAFFFSHNHSGILGDGVLMKILLCTFLLFSSLKLILPAADSFASSFISYRRRMYFVSPYSNRRLYCSLRLPDAFQRERAALTAVVKTLSRQGTSDVFLLCHGLAEGLCPISGTSFCFKFPRFLKGDDTGFLYKMFSCLLKKNILLEKCYYCFTQANLGIFSSQSQEHKHYKAST